MANTVTLPEILSVSEGHQKSPTNQTASVDLNQHNTHVISLEGSRDRVGAKLLLEKLAEELGIKLDLPWNFVPEKIALIGEE